MSESLVFFVSGEARGKQRARAGKGFHYTPKETVDAERRIAWEAKKAMGGRKPFEGALCVEIVATYVCPASWSKKRKAETFWKTSKPDVDNVTKLVWDSLNKIVWIDDSQIAKASETKHYTTGAPGLRVAVTLLG